ASSEAPDPNPHVPQYIVPALACDAHCHVFGPAATFPYAPSRAYTPQDAPRDRLAALHAVLRIERAVIVQASCHGTDNRAMLDAIAHSGGRYRGVAIVDESFEDTDYVTLHEGGIRGVRFNFVRHLGGMPDMKVFHDVIQRVTPLGWHLIVHLDAVDIVELSSVFRSLPMPFVIDHMGRVKASAGMDQVPFRALLDLLQLENCWVKVCGSERVSATGPPFHDAVLFARALVEAAPDRVLWGTDWPHPNVGRFMPNDGDLVDLVPLIAPDDASRHKLLVENPARLYGWQ
ncbi:MAG TPA: amidohydrolase family protein, partial [Vicinamibacterales bacterium]|nr:amidohydrolase family protein [Vicinamibacterales bacterium]